MRASRCTAERGFRSLGWGQTWWYSPGPEPTKRQIALTEAIGLGDLATLETHREILQRLARMPER